MARSWFVIKFDKKFFYFILFIFSQKQLKLKKEIDQSLNVESGESNSFDINNLEHFDLKKIFFLFLPKFTLETTFHFLLIKKKFSSFNSIAEQIDEFLKEEVLEEFLNSEYLKKIEKMFIYILENVNSFYLKAIDTFYCDLSYHYDECDIDSKTEQNIEKIEGFLSKIKDKVTHALAGRPDLTCQVPSEKVKHS